MASWFPSFFPLLGGIILSAVEFFIGISLFFATRRTLATSLALMLMIFMTPLTLYLALFDPVSDCGCFGDAWVLTNWETFGKNVVLLLAAVGTFRYRKMVFRFISVKMEWLVSLYTLFFVFTLSFYCLDRLPVLDFRPYKIGKNISEGMTIPDGAKPSIYESIFVLEKNGEKKEFTLDNYPDSTWTFVDTRTVLKEKGYEPPIHDFSIMDLDTGNDITEDVLTDMGYTFLLVAHRIEEADDSNIDLINEIYDYSVEHGYRFYCLTSSPEEQIELWKDKTGAEYPFCQMDDITLKTMVRSNPGLMLIKNGTILNKWSDEDIPDEYVLTDKLENLPLGQQKLESDFHTVGYVFLWFVIPLLLVLGVDVLVIRRRERKKSFINPLNKENKMNDKIMIEGELNVNLIFTDNSTVGIKTKQLNIPFEQTINDVETADNCRNDTRIEINSQEFLNQSGVLSANVDLEFETDSYQNTAIPVISDISMEDEENMEDYSVVIYVVKSGDTLWKIAKRFGSTVDDIARVNGMERPDKLNIGEKIYIPKYVLKRAKEPIVI